MLLKSGEKTLLSVEQVARRLGGSPATVRRRIYSGELPAVKLGGGPKAPVRVAVDELEDWLASRHVERTTS